MKTMEALFGYMCEQLALCDLSDRGVDPTLDAWDVDASVRFLRSFDERLDRKAALLVLDRMNRALAL